MSTIPASELASVTPSVLGAGGTALDVIGLMLTTNTRVPTGTVLSFPDATAVEDYFGAGTEADQAVIYFNGFDGANKLPASLLFAQYNQAAVAAYLRGGNVSSLTLAQLQAITGTLTITMDGYARVVASLDLSAATSFSSAASIIQTAVNAADPNQANFTASLGASFTASAGSPTTQLVVTSVTGKIHAGDVVSGTGVTAGTKIVSQVSGSTGGAGTYLLNQANSTSAASCTTASNTLEVTVVASGTIGAGQNVQGSGVTDAVITAAGSGTGGVGSYIINGAAQHVASEAMTSEGAPVTVTFDSVSGGFVITSGATGTVSTAAFATGSTAAALDLTSVTGAVLSQGAAVAVPATFMNALIQVNTNWVTFMTLFDPDGGSGNAVKLAFAAWKTTQNDRFAYVCWDTDASPTVAVPATGSMGFILAGNGDSGTALIGQDPLLATASPLVDIASFICGAAAAIDFTETNGRITFAYKGQAALVAGVSTSTIAQNLGGNPQTSNRGNGYNFYGAYAAGAAAATPFIWFQRGFVTGDFAWLDSYINQVQLNASCQAALLLLQKNAKSIPYTISGAALIESALADPIAAALNFGSIAPGGISVQQAALVNGAAGAQVSDTLQTQGYYLQVKQAASPARAARTTPPCTLWYLDRGSVQALNLASVALQ